MSPEPKVAFHDQSNPLDVVYRNANKKRDNKKKGEKTGDFPAPNCKKTNPRLPCKIKGSEYN